MRIKELYIPQLLISLFAFMVGFGGIKLPIASVALILGWLIDVIINRKQLVSDIKSAFYTYIPIALIFILSAASLFYSDPIFGARVLERRILLLVVALVGCIGMSTRINVRVVLKAFVYGVVFAVFWILLQMLIDNFRYEHVNILLRQNFFLLLMDYVRDLQHRTYLGINVSLSMVLLYGYFKLPKLKLVLSLFVMAIFVLSTGARATSLTVLVLFFCFLLHSVYAKVNKKILYAILLSGGLVALLFVVYYPRMIDEIINGAGSDDSRITIWLTALQVIKQKWLLGYGLGDFYPALIEQYKIVGAKHAAQYGLDTHNQYLYLLGELGVVGLFTLLWAFGGYVKVMPKQNRFVAVMLLFVLAFNSLFESVLMRIGGMTSFVMVFLLFRYATILDDLNILSSNNIKRGIKGVPSVLLVCLILYLILFVLGIREVQYSANDPSTYAQSQYEVVSNFPGELPTNFPLDAKGYKLSASAKTVPSLQSVHRTKIGGIDSGSCDSVLMEAYCFVSNDFSGKEIFVGGYAKDYGVKSYYNLNQKGSWQKLEIRTLCPDKEVSYYLQFAVGMNEKVSDLKGYVIFVHPILKKIQ